MGKKYLYIILSLFLLANTNFCKIYIVAESGGDFTKIQDALNIAVAGDTIWVKGKSGPYFEEITFKSSGNSTDGYIVLEAYPNEHPILDGSNFAGGADWPQGLIRIIDRSYIKVIGLEIRNLITSNNDWFPAGIWVRSKSHHIEIINNKIHHIEHNSTDGGAHGIAVYGTHNTTSANNILLEGNEIYDCKLAWSESLVINGNVENFIVRNNVIHDNNNIAFDFIGHEGECSTPELDQARNGLVVNNIAYNIDSRSNPSYEGEGSADGFYVDGGKDIIFERNTAFNCNIGFEIASEHGGKSTSGIIVRNNLIRNNIALGLVIGGYDSQRGSADNCKILNNTLYKNNTENFSWGAEILVQYYCENNLFANNIIYAKSNVPMVEYVTNTGANNSFQNNLYYTEGTPKWLWENNSYSYFENYKSGSNEENESIFANPKLVNVLNNDPTLANNSPAIENGKNLDPNFVGTEDYFGKPRIVNYRIDIGAVEFDGLTSVKGKYSDINNSFHLSQNYPNPFNPTTTIKYSIPHSVDGVGTSHDLSVQLKIYDVLGKEITTLVNKQQKPGIYNITFDTSELTSGIYYYQLNVNNSFASKIESYTETKTMILIK